MAEKLPTLESILEEAKELEVKCEYPEADKLLSSIIKRAKEYRDPDFIANVLNHGGIIKRMLLKHDDALEYYEEALKLKTGDEQKAFAHINIADIYRVDKRDFGTAHLYLDEALSYVENGSLMHAKAVDQRGLVFSSQENYNDAINSYQRAIGICKDLMKNKSNKEIENRFGQSVHHLGVDYIKLNDPEKVDEAYELQRNALKVFKRLGDQQGIVNSVSALGDIAMIENKPNEAIEQYKEAWGILEKTGYGRAITVLALNLAEAYLTKKQSAKAIPYLEHLRDGIINQKVTGDDMALMKNKLNKVVKMYNSCELEINGFKECLLNYT